MENIGCLPRKLPRQRAVAVVSAFRGIRVAAERRPRIRTRPLWRLVRVALVFCQFRTDGARECRILMRRDLASRLLLRTNSRCEGTAIVQQNRRTTDIWVEYRRQRDEGRNADKNIRNGVRAFTVHELSNRTQRNWNSSDGKRRCLPGRSNSALSCAVS